MSLYPFPLFENSSTFYSPVFASGDFSSSHTEEGAGSPDIVSGQLSKLEWVTWTLIKTVSPKASQRMSERCKKCVCIGDGNVLKSYRFLYYFYLFILFANCFMSLNIPLYAPPVSE
jgi:hypothetical protein